MCLQNPEKAKTGLIPTMTKFRGKMDECAALATRIEEQFDTLVACAKELNRAMANEMSKAPPRSPRYRSANSVYSERAGGGRAGRLRCSKVAGRAANTAPDLENVGEARI